MNPTFMNFEEFKTFHPQKLSSNLTHKIVQKSMKYLLITLPVKI